MTTVAAPDRAVLIVCPRCGVVDRPAVAEYVAGLEAANAALEAQVEALRAALAEVTGRAA